MLTGASNAVCTLQFFFWQGLFIAGINLGLSFVCLVSVFLAVAAVIGNFGLFVSLLVLWKAFRGCLRGKGLGTV